MVQGSTNIVRGITFYALLVAAGTAAAIMLFPSTFLIFFHSVTIIQMKRAYVNKIGDLFFSFTAMVLTDVCGTKIFIYSDDPDVLHDSKIGLVISNHNCRVDWMYVGWLYAVICDMGSYLKVIMKDSLRSVPIFGWAAQILHHIFLSRNKDQDIPYIRKTMSYLLHADKKSLFLLFPEGTDLSPSNLSRSLEFAKEKGLREYKKVLYPKPAGFVACLRTLKGFDLSIHDLTVAYKDYNNGDRPSENDFFFGKFPREVHIFVRKFKIDEIADDRKSIESWLHQAFAVKEDMLTQFEQSGCFCNEYKRVNFLNSFKTTARLMVALMVVIALLLLVSPLFRWICAIFVVIGIASRALTGLDSIELELHGSMFLSEMKRRMSSSNLLSKELKDESNKRAIDTNDSTEETIHCCGPVVDGKAKKTN